MIDEYVCVLAEITYNASEDVDTVEYESIRNLQILAEVEVFDGSVLGIIRWTLRSSTLAE